VLAEHLTPGVLPKQIRHRDGKVRLNAPEILAEAARRALGFMIDDRLARESSARLSRPWPASVLNRFGRGPAQPPIAARTRSSTRSAPRLRWL
jgi:hypothetical protein